jgi:hypothetical protein
MLKSAAVNMVAVKDTLSMIETAEANTEKGLPIRTGNAA